MDLMGMELTAKNGVDKNMNLIIRERKIFFTQNQ